MIQLVMGLGQKKFVALVGLGQPPMGLENFPKNPNFFPSLQKKSHQVVQKNTQVKDWSAPYLLRFKSTLRSGQCPSLDSTL